MSRRRIRRRVRASLGLAISAVLITSLLVEVPPIHIPKAAAQAQPRPAPEPQPPIPTNDRESVPDFPPENTIVDPAEVMPEGVTRYARDGIEFVNREKLLPKRPPGYYREFTVPLYWRIAWDIADRNRRGSRAILDAEPLHQFSSV